MLTDSGTEGYKTRLNTLRRLLNYWKQGNDNYDTTQQESPTVEPQTPVSQSSPTIQPQTSEIPAPQLKLIGALLPAVKQRGRPKQSKILGRFNNPKDGHKRKASGQEKKKKSVVVWMGCNNLNARLFGVAIDGSMSATLIVLKFVSY